MASSRSWLRWTLVVFAVATWCDNAKAGGGPENVLLVVNDLDDDSKTIANHYIRWRNLPDNNVLHVKWQGTRLDCPVERYRKQLLEPILQAITQRGLAQQIDYVVYSSGFPYRVNLQADYPEEKFPSQMRPYASLTGATYLWRYIKQKSPAIVSPDTNWYVPTAPNAGRRGNLMACTNLTEVPTRAFRLRYGWDKTGQKATDPKLGQRYLLSTMLGYTDGRGNTTEEVLEYLQRSIQADRTRPDGTFYFAQNNNPRSRARHQCFQGVAAALRDEGARVKVVSGTVPNRALDIVGLTAGAEFVDVSGARSAVMPGAICEHLTSYGGDLRDQGHQMPLTDFLRLGAAGASGTVVEPHAIQAKFPLPTVHLHYRRGCSLAEAFYQSVSGPYQLLIVGDPLCQPWARPPSLTVTGAARNKPLSGEVTFKPRVKPAAGVDQTQGQASPLEVFLDGRLMARPPSNQPLRLNTSVLSEGYHEFRFVAVTSDPIESQSRVVFPVEIDNDPAVSLQLSVSPQQVAGKEEWIHLTATASFGPSKASDVEASNPKQASDAGSEEGDSEREDSAEVEMPASRAVEVIFEQAGRELGRAPLAGPGLTQAGQATAKLRVRGRVLGSGPVRLRAKLDTGVQAAPIWIVVR